MHFHLMYLFPQQPLKRKTNNRKGKLLKRNNEHVSDILKDYTGK